MTEIIKNVFFDDFYLTMIRVLELTAVFKDTKYKLSQKRIVLFDFYLRFPSTMSDDGMIENFDEKYSFYHWKPNYAIYDVVIGILISRGLVVEIEVDNGRSYKITNNGLEALKKMNCAYIYQLRKTGKYIVNSLSKLSEKKIDDDIIKKRKLYKKGEVVLS